ncbi:MAG: leucyl/phenylalanyl-tRNA--protein transferase [Pseudomonadota bacterium]
MSNINLPWLDPRDPHYPFPSAEDALDSPEGLVAAGGDLSPTRLLRAYREGLFPWYEEDQPILWWSPNPRGILYPKKFIAHKSLLRTLKRKNWKVTYDEAFQNVMIACSEPRSYSRGTWITQDMIHAYCHLHQLNHAHSFEVWNEYDQLIGGIYGISIGAIFFGESMFSRETDTSKVALLYLSAYLDHWRYQLVDTQLPSDHLKSLGGEQLARNEYLNQLALHTQQAASNTAWQKGLKLDIMKWLKI